MNIFELIPIGKENAITKEQLISMTGKSDRSVRSEIASLRKSGKVIMSSPSHRGYWIPDSYSELEEFVRQMETYAKSCAIAKNSALQMLKDKDQKRLGIEVLRG